MEYSGQSIKRRVIIIATTGWLKQYINQECDAIFYNDKILPQIDTEQLKPPMPRWQTVKHADIQVIDG